MVMGHQWEQVDYREIVERTNRVRIVDGVKIEQGTPVRIVTAVSTEWCSSCGALRKQFLYGSTGEVFREDVRKPLSPQGCGE